MSWKAPNATHLPARRDARARGLCLRAPDGAEHGPRSPHPRGVTRPGTRGQPARGAFAIARRPRTGRGAAATAWPGGSSASLSPTRLASGSRTCASRRRFATRPSATRSPASSTAATWKSPWSARCARAKRRQTPPRRDHDRHRPLQALQRHLRPRRAATRSCARSAPVLREPAAATTSPAATAARSSRSSCSTPRSPRRPRSVPTCCASSRPSCVCGTAGSRLGNVTISAGSGGVSRARHHGRGAAQVRRTRRSIAPRRRDGPRDGRVTGEAGALMARPGRPSSSRRDRTLLPTEESQWPPWWRSSTISCS